MTAYADLPPPMLCAIYDPMKVASAILRSDRVYIQQYAKTSSGVWIGQGPVYVSSLSSIGEIRENVRAALAGSSQEIPHPKQSEWKEIQRPMLEAVGVRTWAALARDAKAVGIECVDGVVTLTPSGDYEKRGGFDLPEKAIRVAIHEQNLGEKIIDAFALSS